MRTLSGTELTRMGSAHANDWAWVEQQDADGTWRDVGALGTNPVSDFFTSAKLNWSADANVATGTILLRREDRTNSISPLMTGSLINRNALGQYAPLIDVNRRIRVKIAVTDNGVAPVTGDKRIVFDGYTGDVQMGGKNDATLTIPISDLGKLLVISYIDLVREYGAGSGTPMETVMQQILDDTLGAGVVTLYTPASPGAMVHPYAQEKQTVMDALNALAAQIGYVVRYKWDETTQSFRLTFYAPDRQKSTVDATLSPDNYIDLSDLTLVDADIRNNIQVTYTDRATGTLTTLTSTDTLNSIGKYGKRTMQIQEGQVSQIDTATEANTLLAAAYADLATPRQQQTVVLRHWYVAEIGDRYTTTANYVHYDTNATLSVAAFALDISGGSIKATLTMQGQPVGFYANWLKMEGPQSTPSMATGTVRIVAADATSVTVAVDTTIASAQVMLAGLMGGASKTSGPAIGTPSPTGTQWKFTRSQYATGSGVAVFRVIAPALPSTDIPFPIDEQGRDTVSLAMKLEKLTETTTTLTGRVTVADPFPQGHASVIITYAVYGTGVVSPTSGQYLGDSADGSTRTVTASLDTSGYADFVIPKPAVTAAGHARIVFTATANARVQATASMDIPAAGYITPTFKTPTFTEDDTAATAGVTITLNDPQSRATQVRFTAWSGKNTPAVTTVNVGSTLSASVALIEKQPSHIKAEILGTDATGATGVVLDSDVYDFNLGPRPVASVPQGVIGSDGSVTVLYAGDNDTDHVFAKLYQWSGQNAPTITANDVLTTGTASTAGVRKGSLVLPTTAIANRHYTLAIVPVNSSYAGGGSSATPSSFGELQTAELFWGGIGATPDPNVSFRNITATDKYVDVDVVFANEAQNVQLYRQFYGTNDPASSSPSNSTALPQPPSVETVAAEEWNYYNRRECQTDADGVNFVRVRMDFPAPSSYGVLTAVAFDPMNQRATPSAATSIKLLTAAAPPATTPAVPGLAAYGTPAATTLSFTVSNLGGTVAPDTIRLYLNGNAFEDFAVTSADRSAGSKVITTSATLTPSQYYGATATLLASNHESTQSTPIVTQQTAAATGSGGGSGTGTNGKIPQPSISAQWSQGDQAVIITVTPGYGSPSNVAWHVERSTSSGFSSYTNLSPTSATEIIDSVSQSPTHANNYYYRVYGTSLGYTDSDLSTAVIVTVPMGSYMV